MLNFGQIVATVQKNCHISDAQFAADYTLCVFLLKMREFYRWENQIPFSGTLPRDEVGRWMQDREQMWDTLETTSFEPVPLAGKAFDPFDSEAINRTLVPQGYVYSAGYGRFGKPHFFLGNLHEARQRDGVTVYISACEHARDLVAPPAMLLDNVIYLRQESLRRYLWDRIEEWRWNRNNDAMSRAVADYGFDSDIESALDHMTDAETESVILHELGEARVDHLLGPDWPRMLSGLARSKTEILVRAVRDLLADCLATLPDLLERDQRAALHFFFANFSGMRRHLYPEAMTAYQAWQNGDRRALPRLIEDGRKRWLETANRVLALYRAYGPQAGAHIEALLENPPARQIPATH